MWWCNTGGLRVPQLLLDQACLAHWRLCEYGFFASRCVVQPHLAQCKRDQGLNTDGSGPARVACDGMRGAVAAPSVIGGRRCAQAPIGETGARLSGGAFMARSAVGAALDLVAEGVVSASSAPGHCVFACGAHAPGACVGMRREGHSQRAAGRRGLRCAVPENGGDHRFHRPPGPQSFFRKSWIRARVCRCWRGYQGRLCGWSGIRANLAGTTPLTAS